MPNTETTANATTAPAAPAQPSEISIPEYVDSWDEYFLWMATAASIKSKDPRCRVGAVIASQTNVLLSTGFNGLARGVHDDKHVLDDPEEKLKVICHAEQNAILNAARIGVAVEGASIFVTKFPCLACCNHIIQAGISGFTRTISGFGMMIRLTRITRVRGTFFIRRALKWMRRFILSILRRNRLIPRRRKAPARAVDAAPNTTAKAVEGD